MSLRGAHAVPTMQRLPRREHMRRPVTAAVLSLAAFWSASAGAQAPSAHRSLGRAGRLLDGSGADVRKSGGVFRRDR